MKDRSSLCVEDSIAGCLHTVDTVDYFRLTSRGSTMGVSPP